MKKNKIILAVSLCLLLVLVGSYFIYKNYYLLKYNSSNTNYDAIVSTKKFNSTMTIESKKLDKEDYLTIKDFKIKNDFKNFRQQKDEDGNDEYILYNENNNVVASFLVNTTDSFVYKLKNDQAIYDSVKNKLSLSDLTSLLSENNVNNDIELFNYLSKTKNTKNNIFTHVKTMKTNFILEFIASQLPVTSSTTLISGNYEGYIFNIEKENGSTVKEVRLLYNDKTYVITFTNVDKEYFTNAYINELLNSVVLGSDNTQNSTDEKFTSLFSKYNLYTDWISLYANPKTSSKYQNSKISYSYFYDTDSIQKVDDIMKFAISLGNLYLKSEMNSDILTKTLDFKNKKSIEFKEINDKSKELFASEININNIVDDKNNVIVSIMGYNFTYDKNTNSFNIEQQGVGDLASINYYTKIISTKESDGKIEIVNKIMFIACNGSGKCNITKTNQENINNIKGSIATIEKITSTEIDNAIRKYEDKLNSFKWTFTKDNTGNYTLLGVEKIK